MIDSGKDINYEELCIKIGFTQNVVGMVFRGVNGEYKIVDIKKRKWKYPVIALSDKGKEYKYSVDHIRELIGGDNIKIGRAHV